MSTVLQIKHILLTLLVGTAVAAGAAEVPVPIKALLITGGCCHDYDNQKTIIPEGVNASTTAAIDWMVVHEGGKAGNVEIPYYTNPDWAKGYDVVVHNECFAKIPNADYIQGILAPHRAGTPAVLVHCAMHCYRTGSAKEDWWEFCGVHSPRHGAHHPLEVEIIDTDHEITRGLSNWTTPAGELYFINTVYPGTVALAQSKSDKTGEMHITIWAHEYGENNARVFATTIGHHNETMQDPAYLRMLTRGLLWAAGQDVDSQIHPYLKGPE